jgi:two-component system LytT family response regulator
MEAQGKYTDIYCEGDRMLTSSKNVGEFASMLASNNFVKVHRSHLVNLDKVVKFSKSDGGTLITSDNKEIPVSKQGKERLFEKL